MAKRQATPKHLRSIAPGLRELAVPIEKLKLNEDNPKIHADQSIARAAASLKAYGQQKPVVVGPKGVVIAGNGLLLAAERLGWTHLAAVRTNLPPTKRKAYAIADNRVAEFSEWDEDVLARQLADLQDSSISIEAVGYDEDEISALLAELEEVDEPAEADEPAAPVRTRTVADTVVTIGGYRFTVPRVDYEEWLEKLRQKVGLDDEAIIGELKRRLKL